MIIGLCSVSHVNVLLFATQHLATLISININELPDQSDVKMGFFIIRHWVYCSTLPCSELPRWQKSQFEEPEKVVNIILTKFS